MTWLDIKGLSEKYQKLTHDANVIGETAHKENRSMNSEEETNFDKLHNEAEDCLKQIEQIRKQQNAEKALEERIGRVEFSVTEKGPSKEERQAQAFSKFLRSGNAYEYRAESELDTTTAGHGLEHVPQSFFKGVVEKAKAYGGILEAGASVLYRDSMEWFNYGVSDDTANRGEIVGESTAVTNDDTYDPVSSKVTIKPFTWNSKWIKVSHQLLRTVAYDLDADLKNKLAIRFGRGVNYYATLGNGSTAPQGLVAATSEGKETASATAVTWNEFLDLKHSVNSAYRNAPTSGFMFSDATLLAIKKLSLTTGAQLWTAGNPAQGVPALIDGNRYTINDDMASAGTAENIFALYGDFSKFQVDMINDQSILVAREKFIDTLEFGYLMYASFGCNLLDTNAIKHMVHKAS